MAVAVLAYQMQVAFMALVNVALRQAEAHGTLQEVLHSLNKSIECNEEKEEAVSSHDPAKKLHVVDEDDCPRAWAGAQETANC